MARKETFRAISSWSLGDHARVSLAALLLVSISLGFGVGSFSQFRRHLLWLTDRSTALIRGHPTPERITAAVEIADRFVPGRRTCLMRSLTAEILLRLYDFTPEHCIGVDNAGNQLEAHSWIEYEEDILIGDQSGISKFEPLPPLETHTSS